MEKIKKEKERERDNTNQNLTKKENYNSNLIIKKDQSNFLVQSSNNISNTNLNNINLVNNYNNQIKEKETNNTNPNNTSNINPPGLVNKFLKKSSKILDKKSPITNTSLDFVLLNQNNNIKKITKGIFEENQKNNIKTKSKEAFLNATDNLNKSNEIREINVDDNNEKSVKLTEGKECEALNNLDEVDNFFIDDITSKQVMQFIPKIQPSKNEFKSITLKELKENQNPSKILSNGPVKLGSSNHPLYSSSNINTNVNTNINANSNIITNVNNRGKSPNVSKNNNLFSEQKKRLYSSKGRKFEIKNTARPYTAIPHNNKVISSNMSPRMDKIFSDEKKSFYSNNNNINNNNEYNYNNNDEDKYMPRIEKHNRPQTAAIHKSNTSNNIINININFYNVDLNKKYFNPNEIQKNLIYCNENMFKRNIGDLQVGQVSQVGQVGKPKTETNFMPKVNKVNSRNANGNIY